VQDGDFVLIDYEGFKDGKPFEHAKKTENYTMKIGAAKIAKEVDEKLTGMNKGEEVEIEASFPENHFNTNFAGHKISFKIYLRDIREEVLPELDDEFAKKMGPYESIDMLKQAIIENLTQGYEKRTEQELSEQVFSKLLEKNEFEVPDAMINAELDAIIAEMEKSFSFHNMPEDQIENTRNMLRAQYRDVAEKQVKRQLLLNKLVEQEKPELSEEEIEAGIEDMARAYDNPVEEVKKFYKENPDKIEPLKPVLLEKKMISLIINNSEIQEVELEIEKEAGGAN
jgi:trigger factor